jgi:hypothetical protein
MHMANKDETEEFISDYQKAVTHLIQKYGKDLLLQVKELNAKDLEDVESVKPMDCAIKVTPDYPLKFNSDYQEVWQHLVQKYGKR